MASEIFLLGYDENSNEKIKKRVLKTGMIS